MLTRTESGQTPFELENALFILTSHKCVYIRDGCHFVYQLLSLCAFSCPLFSQEKKRNGICHKLDNLLKQLDEALLQPSFLFPCSSASLICFGSDEVTDSPTCSILQGWIFNPAMKLMRDSRFKWVEIQIDMLQFPSSKCP